MKRLALVLALTGCGPNFVDVLDSEPFDPPYAYVLLHEQGDAHLSVALALNGPYTVGACSDPGITNRAVLMPCRIRDGPADPCASLLGDVGVVPGSTSLPTVGHGGICRPVLCAVFGQSSSGVTTS